MADAKKKTPAEDLIESLLKEVGGIDESTEHGLAPENISESDDETLVGLLGDLKAMKSAPVERDNAFNLSEDDEKTRMGEEPGDGDSRLALLDDMLTAELEAEQKNEEPALVMAAPVDPSESTVALDIPEELPPIEKKNETNVGDSEKTIAVTGFQIKSDLDYDDKIKVSVGQNRTTAYSQGYAAWGSGSDSNLAQAENLRMAQDKILELERENEQLRRQNEELISASEIIKERSDLLTAQVTEFKNDRNGLEESFKNETTLLKNHLSRKDAELQRTQFKIDELESRLKFDMKKIRIRERELENRLELVRAEKNAVVKNKDEQILDLRRKMDIVQMEVDSYRQKCVELNKLVEINQESFKRTTRALRLAMANLELQDENKVPLKKVD